LKEEKMVTASLKELDINKLLVKLEKLTRVEFPRDVIEVSLEPKLNMLCIRFRKPIKAEFGEPIYPGVHLFSDKDTEEIAAVEIVDLDRFGES
jgi:hypothetical protein